MKVVCINDQWATNGFELVGIYWYLPKIGDRLTVREFHKKLEYPVYAPYDAYEFEETHVPDDRHCYCATHFAEIDESEATETETTEKENKLVVSVSRIY